MNNSVLKLALVLGTLLATAIPGTAQQSILFDKSTVRPGLVLVYVDNRKKQFQLTMVSRTEFRNDRGERYLRNTDGNSLASASRKFSPHSGYRPPGTQGKLQVGMQWTHSFSVDGVKRTRNCKVAKSGTYKNRYVVVANAFLVQCLNKRADRPKGINEQIWFSPLLLTELEYRSRWSGGSYSHQLIGVR